MTTSSSSGRAFLSQRSAPAGVILALACIAQFMVVLDVSIVNVALPSIAHDLDYSPTGLQWVVNAYVLTFAGFLLLGGRTADLFGRRRVFLAGVLIFSLASLLGGFAQNSAELTTARAAQGLGGAVLSPATLTIIMTTFTEGAARHRALGAWSAVAGLGGGVGVILGGVLTAYLSWRWVLFVNVPIGAMTGLLAIVFLHESRRDDADRRLDFPGAVLATAGLALLVYGIVGTDTYSWTSTRTVATIAIAAALLVMFVVHQARFAGSPLMPLSLFRSRSVTSANVVMLLLGSVFFSMWYFLSLYLQDVHHDGPLRTGLLFLPMAIAISVGAQISARLIAGLGPRALLITGLGLAAIGFAWLSQMSATTSYADGVLVGTMLISFGMGLSFTPLATAATAGVHWTQAGLASGVLNTSRQVGGSLGLAVLATIATSRTGHLVTAGTLTAGYTRAFAVAAVVAAIGAVAATAIPAARSAASAEATGAVEPAPATAELS